MGDRRSQGSHIGANAGLGSGPAAQPPGRLLTKTWGVGLGHSISKRPSTRGTILTVEPRTGQPGEPVSPLVRAKSADVGFASPTSIRPATTSPATSKARWRWLWRETTA